MKAIIANSYGGPEVLTYADHPEPKVGPDSFLIRVKAAGVNPVDWKILAGYLDPMLDGHFPLIPGWDVAGVVEAVGADATEYAVGDEVIGYVRKDEVQHGTFAELVAAPVRTLARKPASLSWQEAAGLPLAGLTAYQALDRVGVTAGETVLVHAAAGGVGSLAVQIAVAQGARVIGTVASTIMSSCGPWAPSRSFTVRGSPPGCGSWRPKASTRPWTSSAAASWTSRRDCSRTAAGWPPSPTARSRRRAVIWSGSARTPPT